MKKNVKAMYVAPMVELLEARVEKGFAGSAQGNDPITPSTGSGALVHTTGAATGTTNLGNVDSWED